LLLEDDDDPEESLQRSWLACKLARLEGDLEGARSFGWIALGTIFDTIKHIEDNYY